MGAGAAHRRIRDGSRRSAPGGGDAERARPATTETLDSAAHAAERLASVIVFA
jgi:hypothetical protein